MVDIRNQQQLLIAYKIYQIRSKEDISDEPNPLLGYGAAETDLAMAGRVLDHFEDDLKTSDWYLKEEDYNGFRELFTEDYKRFLCGKFPPAEEDTHNS